MTSARITVKGTAGPYDLRLSLTDGHEQNMVYSDGPEFAVDVIDLPNRRSHQGIVAWNADMFTHDHILSAMRLLYKAATGGEYISAEYRGHARLWITEDDYAGLIEAIEIRAKALRTTNYNPASREKLAAVLSADALKLSAWARAYIVKGH